MTNLALNVDAASAYLAPLSLFRRMRRSRPLLGLTPTETKLFHAWRP